MGGIVEAIFGGGGKKDRGPAQFAPIEPAKPPPGVDESTRVAEERARLRRRRGSAANVLAGDAAPTGGETRTASKVLLGE